MVIEGKITRLFFQSETKACGYFELNKPTKINGSLMSSVRINANVYNPSVGMALLLEGDYVEGKYGYEFVATKATIDMFNLQSIKSILNSGFIEGVGPVLADRIVSAFGKDTYDIIKNNHLALVDIPGISKSKAEKIKSSFEKASDFFDLLDYFKGQITDYQVKCIYEKYGDKSISVLEKDPYTLIEIDGFGFKKVDNIAQKAGIKIDDPKRIKAAIVYTLKTISEDGHCYCHVDSLDGKIRELVDNITVPVEIVASELANLVKEQRIKIVDDIKVYLDELYNCEKYCGRFVSKLVNSAGSPLYNKATIDFVIDRVNRRLGFELDSKQCNAVHEAIRRRFSVVTGGPGTGKTTVINAIVDAFISCGGKKGNVILAAPTGRASRRMKEATGFDASTIHSFCAKENEYNGDCLFIVDEASMIDLKLCRKYFEEINNIIENRHISVQIVMIGDIDQLPPIGPGNVFRDLVSSPVVPTTRLELSHRFAGPIAINADRIRTGRGVASFVRDDNKTFGFYSVSKDVVADKVINAYIEAIKEYPQREVQIIVPMKTRSKTAANELNLVIRDKVNPDKGLNFQVTKDRELRMFDRVMQTVNRKDMDVYNGDCGTITNILGDGIIVTFDDGREVEYNKLSATDLILAYATTIHKSQGSEYSVVITSFTTDHYIMLQRNLLYTAVTRAKKKLMIFCEPKAIEMGVANNPAISRNTDFKKFLV